METVNMKSELFKIADMLMLLMSKSNKDVINVYKKNINSNNLDTARIISDELVDYFAEMDDGSTGAKRKQQLSSELYDKTMEYYELNS